MVKTIQCKMFCIVLLFTCVVLQSSFIGAVAIGDLVKSTLGPKGMVSTTNNVLHVLYAFHVMVFYCYSIM